VNILGLDTATAATAAALLCSDASESEARDDPAEGAHPGHATRLLGLADELLTQAGLQWSEVDRITVGVGPGTFTGLRVGLATARGLAQGLAAELVGVSSLAALAWAFAADGQDAAERDPLAVIDARRGEVFAAAYLRGEPRSVTDPQALAPQQLDGVLRAAAGSAAGAHDWLAVGDGALRYRAELEALGIEVAGEESSLHRVRALAICQLGAREDGAQRLHAVLPDYRRRPDAELALAGRGGGA
jgi:tRNA threonylcarbamoyladenosine biosynthesis protein TsaB